MKKVYILISVVFLSVISVFAQEEDQKFGVEFNGLVKNDVFFDTRQTLAAREGHFLLWPSPENIDIDGHDINSRSSFNILAVQSRLSGTITGPDAFGAKTSGMIEGDFFAQANDNINLFRLRHAFVQLDWEKTSLLFGQYWNPLFVTSCFPGTVSFNTGAPIQSFSRDPQVRLTHSRGNISFIAAALSHRDYPSYGEDGPSSEYLRNSGMPDMHFQLHYNTEKFVTGAGLAYKKIVPRLETQWGREADEEVKGLSAIAFAKLRVNPLTIKVQALSGQNIADAMNISGFAVEDIEFETDDRTYLPLRNLSLWTDIHTNGENFQAGLFAGYTQNRGTADEISNADFIYGLGTDIESLFRISPRLVFNSGKVRFGIEGEYTEATFGEDYDEYAVPVNTHSTGNLRILFSAYYFF
ncbi:MAG: hypothetical protein ACLFPH_04800 [Bacteroidales bacterium]